MGDIKDIISNTKFNSLIKDQLYNLDENLSLAIEDYARIPLLIQTVHGRAIKGHGLFEGESRPNITMDEICIACDIDPQIMRTYRQEIANDTKQTLVDIIYNNKKTLTNRRGEPLGGVQFLDGVKIDTSKESIKCFAIGGGMDTHFSRAYAEHLYSTTLDGKRFRIGSGEEHPINKKILEEQNIPLISLSTHPHSPETMEKYKSLGIIVGEDELNLPHVENKFIRYHGGAGICDDQAMISAGRKYGISGMKILFVTDMNDSYTKFNNDEVYGGEDGLLKKMAEEMWLDKRKEKLIDPKEIAEIVYISSKNNMKLGFHSSSHRYLVQKEAGANISTFMRHENFVRFGEMGNYELGFERLNSKLFYNNLNNKFEEISKLGTVDGNDYTVLTK